MTAQANKVSKKLKQIPEALMNPFECKECNLRFKYKWDIAKHIKKVHDPNFQRPKPQNKSFKCPKCGREFSRKYNCDRHRKTHQRSK
jgi:uncharacterized Zn-finger protein